MTADATARAQSGTHANVRVAVHDIEALRSAHPDWDALGRQQRLQAARATQPERVIEESNTTTVGFHEAIVDLFDEDQTASWEATHLGVGTDDSSFSSSDTSLNSSVNRFAVTDSDDNGTTLGTSTFIDTGEANGNTLKEVGLFTASSGGKMLNHSEIADVVKTNNKTVTVDVDLTIQPV